MIKQFICWLWGHKIEIRADYSTGEGLYWIRSPYCNRCGKDMEE